MRFIISLICTTVLLSLLYRPLRKYPVFFYACALGIDALYAFAAFQNYTGGFWSYFLPLIQRCSLAFVLFSVVMFTGVLKQNSSARTYLSAIRRQLSILACILCFGHIVHYGSLYISRLFSPAASAGNIVFSLALSALLTVLLIILMVTSFTFIRSKMSAAVWEKVQKLAYPFYLLVYVHLLLLLLPAALAGKATSIESLMIYSSVFVLYSVMRLRRVYLDKKASSQSAALSVREYAETS